MKMKMKIIKSNRNLCQLWCRKRDERKWAGRGRRATKTNRKLEDGDAGDDDDCVAEMPPLERKKTAAPLRIELRDLHLAGGGEGCCVGMGRK